jgi:prepilin-type N-terminal cleavage/methylation domain-containing protein
MNMKHRLARLRTAHYYRKGFSLVELLVSASIFALLAVSVYQSYAIVTSVVSASRVKILATDLANEQLELIRNLPYPDVGVVSSIPAGVVPYSSNITRGGFVFTVTTTIRNIDDPFDGTIGGTPNDLSPADYKLVHLDITCATCKNFVPMSVVSRVAPKNLETSSSNGALFIRVFNTNGQPVPQANVSVINNMVSPAITINDQTDNQGMLQIVDAPPSVQSYQITVTKSGYTTDKTYATSTANPNPSKPHATVLLQQVTQISFVIDQVSTMNVSTLTETCAAVPSVHFIVRGSKLIGTPSVYKYEEDFTSSGSGFVGISNIDGDAYTLTLATAGKYLAGVNPLLPVTVLSGATQDVQLIVTTKTPRHLLVTVKDSATMLPLSGATAQLSGPLAVSALTGRGFVTQTDWSGGPGQSSVGDPTRYDTSDGNINVTGFPGELKLSSIFGAHSVSGNLTSSIFDTGTTTNFNQISWAPLSQPPQTGADSIRFQIATSLENTAMTSWQYLGPDGTSGSFFTTSDTNIHNSHNNSRYIRYKAYLNTASTSFTPSLSDVSVTFTSACIPPGQVLFSELPSGTYTLTVTKSGYSQFDSEVQITNPWQSQEVILIPQ